MALDNILYTSRIFLLVLLGAILMASFVATNTINYKETKKILEKELIEDSLPAETEKIAHKINIELLPYIIASENLAHDHFVKQWINNGEPDKDSFVQYIDATRDRIGAITCFLASGISETYYHPGGYFPILRTDPDAQWYFAFRDSDKTYELNRAKNVDMNNMPTIFINYRITGENGQFLGVVGMGLELAEIPRILGQFKGRYDRSIYFVDAEGTVVSRSSGAIFTGDNIQELSQKGSTIENFLSKDATVFEYEHKNSSIIVSTQHVPELNWWLFIEQEKALAMRTANRVMTISAAIDLGSIFLTMILVFMTVSFFHTKLKTMAATDKLTGISNRLTFEHMLQRAFVHFSRSKNPFAVLILDLDHFKQVNDTYGHLEGDKVLKKTVGIVKNTIRESDEFCRWGGEEFVILAYNCTMEQGVDLAEKIRTNIKNAQLTVLPNGNPITVSIGVCDSLHYSSPNACINEADNALYKAKQEGRDRVRGC